ncbi:MAG: ketoacyl-ACP synthase III [Bdellovibrionales bacterium]|nr:ketoacyl-ACP synthase III [Bdellovibrionales bacterium]
MLPSIRSAITGAAKYHPEKIVTNQDLSQSVETSDEWIQTRTGIKERRQVKKGQAASDLAVLAIEKVLKKTQTNVLDIDLIIVGTVTPDMMFPSTACVIQNKIGAKNAWGFDLSAACSGFLFSLGTADQFIRSGRSKKALVVGVDVMSSIIDPQDRNTCVLFGDGAGVVLLEPLPDGLQLGILDFIHHIDGSGGELLCMPGGGSLNPTTPETIEKKMHVVHQEGKQVFKFAVGEMARVSEEILERNGFKPEDVTLFVPHQANLRIIESCQKKLGLPNEKVMVNIDKFANTTSATIPSCLAMAAKEGRIKKGDLVLLASFGAGFTWGATLLRWAY